MSKLSLSALLALAVAIPAAQAQTISAVQTPGLSYDDGGQFTATTSSGWTFQTFCIEIQHTFSPGSPYNFTLGQTTHGAPPATASGVLNMGTAYLFSQFAAGAVNLNTPALNGEFQEALWYFQGQGRNGDGAFDAWTPGAIGYKGNQFITLADSNVVDPLAASGGALGVQVVQVENGQDWLAVPDGSTTLVLLGMGMGSLALVARRVRR
jgi:hypothetical protein